MEQSQGIFFKKVVCFSPGFKQLEFSIIQVIGGAKEDRNWLMKTLQDNVSFSLNPVKVAP